VNFSRRSLLNAFALLPGSRLLRSQQSIPNPPDTTFSTDVKVVMVFATVRNKQGQVVRNLTKDDFLLDEDGRPQTIRYFSQESDLPLTVGLLVDTSGSTRRVLPDERNASYRFLEQVLREDKDQAFVIHFDFEVELLQDLTPSRAQLEKALNMLETPQDQRPQMGRRNGGQSPGPYPGSGRPYPGGGRRRGGTSLYDAVFMASDELMKKQKGRKSLILLSDGVDNGSRLTLSECVASAQRADTLVYSILFEDPQGNNFRGFGGPRMGCQHGGWGGGRGPAMNRPDGKKVLEQISRETGGRFFEVSGKQPIDKVFTAIEEDLRNQYSIGYTPTGTTPGYRRIHVASKQKGLTVQAREGYYPT
jgi:VWFA-related protein